MPPSRSASLLAIEDFVEVGGEIAENVGCKPCEKLAGQASGRGEC